MPPTNFDVPREHLYRMMVPMSEFRVADDDTGDGMTLIGYAARFDTPTLIASWEGEFEETIRRGAFAKTIAERGSRNQGPVRPRVGCPIRERPDRCHRHDP